jgi:hypothetical protein
MNNRSTVPHCIPLTDQLSFFLLSSSLDLCSSSNYNLCYANPLCVPRPNAENLTPPSYLIYVVIASAGVCERLPEQCPA